MQDQIGLLQKQVDELYMNLNNLRSSRPPTDVLSYDPLPTDPSQTTAFSDSHIILQTINESPAARHTCFQGPTSAEFNLNVAKSSLQKMGITPTEDTVPEDLSGSHLVSLKSPHNQLDFSIPPIVHHSKDPLWSIKRENVIRLCNLYENEIGSLYPMFDMEKVTEQANLLYNFMEAATRTGFTNTEKPGADRLHDDQTIDLKMILSIALLIEGDGHSELAAHIFNSVKPSIHEKLWGPASIHTALLITMAVSVHFLLNPSMASHGPCIDIPDLSLKGGCLLPFR